MPTYQYACTACGHRFDAVQAFTDATLTECPQCAGRLRKVFSSVGIVFKGSGFYRTDSRSRSGASTESSGGSSPEKKSDATASSSSDSSSSSSSSSSELSTAKAS